MFGLSSPFLFFFFFYILMVLGCWDDCVLQQEIDLLKVVSITHSLSYGNAMHVELDPLL